jgi:hypothetical protein
MEFTFRDHNQRSNVDDLTIPFNDTMEKMKGQREECKQQVCPPQIKEKQTLVILLRIL